jgi:hypothetical protein
MNHIDINYRLAKAMGWGVDSRGVSNMRRNGDCVQCRPEGNVLLSDYGNRRAAARVKQEEILLSFLESEA